ncbi:MAG TPA: SCO family protein [Candidatus Didemnitutus sp.]|nr:SCO family protein [Candidatus Didemnitutus sp.]
MKPSYSPAASLVLCILMAGGIVTGCGKKEKPAAPQTDAAPAAPAEKRYAIKGEILEIKAAEKVLIIHHEAIPDYMPSMTMEFIVSKGDIENAKVGQRIRGEMFMQNGNIHLEKIWPDDTQTNSRVDAATKALAQDTATRGRGVYREVGEDAPDFTLLDQEGRTVSVSSFRGKQVMLNFIFTRCPVATMCPAATMRMMALQKAAKEAGIKDVEFVSISLDPEYDTPGVLKEYAEVRGIDTSNFTFLTGPDAAVRHLLAQMGIIREFEGETIKHTLATVLINPQGRIAHRVDGSTWDTQEFLSKMKKG